MIDSQALLVIGPDGVWVGILRRASNDVTTTF